MVRLFALILAGFAGEAHGQDWQAMTWSDPGSMCNSVTDLAT